MHIVVDLIMYALQCNKMTWQIFSLHNTKGVTAAICTACQRIGKSHPAAAATTTTFAACAMSLGPPPMHIGASHLVL
jgi:hypothetical protein